MGGAWILVRIQGIQCVLTTLRIRPPHNTVFSAVITLAGTHPWILVLLGFTLEPTSHLSPQPWNPRVHFLLP